jgi:serine/threonine protein kinase
VGPTGLPLFTERYLPVQKIAEGGMAEIFLARDLEQDPPKLVVLKRILPLQAKNPEFVKMFHDEARLASTLSHPNVVKVFELARSPSGPFMVMEYLAGYDLHDLRRVAHAAGAWVPWQLAIAVAVDASEGVHAAHLLKAADGAPMNVIHRDLSPSNIFVTWDGAVKVLDFGIAHAQRRLAQTQAGMVKGKSQYMAPEQITGEPIDGRVDQFALGAVLYELLTNTAMFQADNDLAALNKILTGVRPLASERRAGLPRGLDQVLCKATHAKREERYGSMREFGDALRAVTGRPAPSRDQLANALRTLLPSQFEQHATFMSRLASANTDELRQVAREKPLELPDEDAVVSTQLVDATPMRPRPGRAELSPGESTRGGGWLGWVGLAAVLALALTGVLEWKQRANKPVVAAPTGSLTVRSDPPGASVAIDGAPVSWTTPFVLDTISLGHHLVQVELADRVPVKVEVELSAQSPTSTVSAVLPRFSGSISLRVLPANATVTLDGAAVLLNVGDIVIADVASADPHVLQVSAPGFLSQRRSISVVQGETTFLELKLEAVR